MQNKGLWAIHSASIILSFTGFFANQISLPALDIIAWRCVIAAGFLSFLFLMLKPSQSKWQKQDWFWLVICGVLSGIHWWTFFAAMQYAGWAIGTLTLFCFPMLTVLFEPLFNGKRQWPLSDILLALLSLFGIALLALPNSESKATLLLGIANGLLSALVWSVRNILYKQHLSKLNAWRTMRWQLLIAALVLLPFVQSPPLELDMSNLGLLLVLAIGVTAIPHSLILYSMQHLSAKTTSIVASLQPVYATTLAVLILNEPLSFTLVLGMLCISGAVWLETWQLQRKRS